MTVKYYDEKKEKSIFLEGVSKVSFYYNEETPIACVHFADPGKPIKDIALANLYRIEG